MGPSHRAEASAMDILITVLVQYLGRYLPTCPAVRNVGTVPYPTAQYLVPVPTVGTGNYHFLR
jgi:hypothetical protein